jgi:acyl-CoA synthetase (AMP-forming)/AMP-acid ligase II
MLDGPAAHEGHVLSLIGLRAEGRGDDPAVSFVEDGSGTIRTLTWSELEARAWAARRALEARGLRPGDRVVLAMPTSASYLSALLGAMWGGLLPSTFSTLNGPATSLGSLSEWRAMLDSFAPSLVVGDHVPASLGVPVLAPAALEPEGPGATPARCYSELRELAYVQFTSGSTGRPRGLALGWSGIRANLAAIARCGPIEERDCVVSWLPMYHDMGLFGCLLTALYVGCRSVYMDPSLFARNPFLWLRLLQDQRATIAVAPPSALQRCIELVRRRQSSLDLSTLRKVLCGSEPIAPAFVESFREVLVPRGVPESALKPVYGLAEATLAVTFPPCDRPPRIDRVRRDAFETLGRAEPAAAADKDVHSWVSVGAPLPDVSLRIVDEAGAIAPSRSVGSVFVRSPSLMSAVIENDTLSPTTGGWLDTGDLGYLADGELFVTGRRKDVIIKYGRNHSPDRLEQLACQTGGVRRAAAFGVFEQATLTEKIVIVVEARAKDLVTAADRDRLRLAVRGMLQDAGYAVDEIALAQSGELPRTTSGKIRRRHCRELYLERRLGDA